MWLFGLFGKKKKKRTNAVNKSSKTNSFGERKDRLTRKGELPYGWLYENRDFIKKTEREYKFFTDAYDKSKRQGISQEYAALKSLIRYMEDIKKLCSRKGECFAYWSSYTVADTKYITQLKAKLKKLDTKRKNAK